MREEEIISAIERSNRGISQYLSIMNLLPNVDVSTDRDFQRQYNGFYRVRQRPQEWYDVYYSYLEDNRNNRVLFEDVLDHLNDVMSRYEPSFSSKLAATLNPNEPIWDKFVLQNTNQRAPSYSSSNKIEQAKATFQNIRNWYANYMVSEEGLLVVEIFNQMIDESDQISDLKKIDFVLWQTRD
jgi:hypothetical protein